MPLAIWADLLNNAALSFETGVGYEVNQTVPGVVVDQGCQNWRNSDQTLEVLYTLLVCLRPFLFSVLLY